MEINETYQKEIKKKARTLCLDGFIAGLGLGVLTGGITAAYLVNIEKGRILGAVLSGASCFAGTGIGYAISTYQQLKKYINQK